MWRRGRKKRNGRQWVSGVFLISWITCSPSLCLAECGDPVKFKAATAARRLETITALQSRFAPWRAEQKGPSALNSISVSQQPLSRPRSITHTLPQHHCTTGPSRSQRESKREGIDLEHTKHHKQIRHEDKNQEHNLHSLSETEAAMTI